MAITLLRRAEGSRRLGESRSTTYERIKAGLLPPPISMGRMVAWPDYEIEAIIRARIAGKSDDEIKALVVDLTAARKNANSNLPVQEVQS